MAELWTTLLPLAIGSALIPIEIALTIVLLRGPGGVRKALAWVGGMTVVRLVQLVVLGSVIRVAVDDGEQGTSIAEGAVLLVVGVLFLVVAARKATNQPDEDAPPPGWMTILDGASIGRAFVMGAGLIAVNPKLWAFTIAAIGAIGDAQLDGPASIAAFLVFVIVAQSVHLTAIAVTALGPDRAKVVLDSLNVWLVRYSRTLLIGLSMVFGVWLLLLALESFGIL
jgi:threonine/homoserine/homoserine lactone efflux protein